ncbi:MAG: NfeD family protein [Lewinellaceae bacterium]|nr:NfeD family protein [Saprospiraceae bacterium]MCB9334327.1 NfeD family protein [Lewinellaceae bacterium]
MLLNLFNWWESLGGAEQWFWAIALIFNVLFALYLVVQFSGGHDTDVDGDFDLDDADAGFAVLSLRSLLAFGMFMGYTGVVVIRQGGGWLFALLAGTAAGTLAAWLAWRLLRTILRLQSSGTLELENTIGQTGEVHLQIPALSKGTGKVMVEVQGALREMDAVSESESIPTGAAILVVGLTDDGTLIVQPFEPLPRQKLKQKLMAF